MNAAIEVHGLTKRFGDVVAVDHIDLEVWQGELFGLLGPNGAGKTTLLRMLIGLIPITSGQARIAGIDIQQDPDGVRRALGVVPQALTSDLELTAYENLDIYGRFFGVGRARRRARIDELLHRVGLWERRNDLVSTFSGGMRRRLEIARGLIHTPKVLFLDEPTIGLDPQSRRVIWELLADLRKGADLTISLTTHYLDEADVLCDRVAIVDHGKLVALGTPQELKSLVPGSDTLDLGLVSEPPPEVVASLGTLPGVRAIERTGQGLRIRADGGAELLPKVFERLRAEGGEIHSANVSRITLEDVFIHFTGRSLREEAPARRQAPIQRRFT